MYVAYYILIYIFISFDFNDSITCIIMTTVVSAVLKGGIVCFPNFTSLAYMTCHVQAHLLHFVEV